MPGGGGTSLALAIEPDRAVRVLVVDDDPTLRNMLTLLLEREGFEPRAVADVDQALACLAGETIDAVLTDLIMPGRSGLVLLAELRGRHPAVPVIAMTGSESPALREAALVLGACVVLRKPFVLPALVDLLGKMTRAGDAVRTGV
jgi:DNA-binding NtrC family response regulator